MSIWPWNWSDLSSPPQQSFLLYQWSWATRSASGPVKLGSVSEFHSYSWPKSPHSTEASSGCWMIPPAMNSLGAGSHQPSQWRSLDCLWQYLPLLEWFFPSPPLFGEPVKISVNFHRVTTECQMSRQACNEFQPGVAHLLPSQEDLPGMVHPLHPKDPDKEVSAPSFFHSQNNMNTSRSCPLYP